MSRRALLKALRDDADLSHHLMAELARMFRQVSKDAYH
jgi:hypothetical protein